MEQYKDKIVEIATDYDCPQIFIEKYLNILLEYPFIADGDEERLFHCLELVIEDRLSQRNIQKIDKDSYLQRNVSDTISEMIFRIYGEEAFYYLNRDYLNNRGISVYSEYDEFLGTISDEEIEYQGYKRR